MATPFVAGSAALLLQILGKNANTARNMRALLEATANPVPSAEDGSGPLQTLVQQGAGLINVFNAAHYKTSISPTEILLNDTAHFNGQTVLTIKNGNTKTQSYTISHSPAGTIDTYPSVRIVFRFKLFQKD
jgi:hypothetical protein